jgi:actin-related protein
MVFESLQATNYFTCKSPVLSSFSCGKGASLVIDSGHTATWAVPVIDGYALQKNAIRFPIGGNYLNNKVIQYVEKTYNNKYLTPNIYIYVLDYILVSVIKVLVTKKAIEW